MRKPLLFALLFSSILFITAQVQPQSLPAAVEAKSMETGGGAATTAEHFDGKVWWDYVKILAADNMEGRETGSPGLRQAQEYVVEQFKHAGLEPAGSKSFYQPVQLVSRQIVEKDSSLSLVHNGQLEPLALG